MTLFLFLITERLQRKIVAFLGENLFYWKRKWYRSSLYNLLPRYHSFEIRISRNHEKWHNQLYKTNSSKVESPISRQNRLLNLLPCRYWHSPSFSMPRHKVSWHKPSMLFNTITDLLIDYFKLGVFAWNEATADSVVLSVCIFEVLGGFWERANKIVSQGIPDVHLRCSVHAEEIGLGNVLEPDVRDVEKRQVPIRLTHCSQL